MFRYDVIVCIYIIRSWTDFYLFDLKKEKFRGLVPRTARSYTFFKYKYRFIHISE